MDPVDRSKQDDAPASEFPIMTPAREQPVPVGSSSDALTIVRGAAVNFIGTVARLTKSVSFIVLTRLFGAEIFGLYMLGWTIVDLVVKVGQFSLDKGLVNFIPRLREDGDTDGIHRTIAQALGVGLLLSAVVSGVLFIAAPALAEGLLGKPRLTGMLRLLAAALPLIVLTHVILGVTRAHKVMKYDAMIRGAVEPLVLFGAACASFYWGWHTYGIAAAHLAALACGLLFALYVFARFYSWRACLVHLRELRIVTPLTRFSLPVMGYELVYMVMIRLDVLMVGYFLPAAQVGIYVIAVEIALLTKKVRQWFDPVFSPIVAELNHRKDLRRLEHNLRLVTRWVLTIGVGFLCVVSLIGDELLGLFGPEFGAGFMAMVVLAMSQVAYGAMGSGDTVLIMSGRPWLNLVNTIVVVIVNFALNLWLIPTLGILGAALGTLVSFMLLTLIRLAEVYHLFRIHPLTWRILKPCAAAVLAFGCAFLAGGYAPEASWLRMAVLPLIFLAVYLGVLCLLGLEEEDRNLLRRLSGALPLLKKRPGVSRETEDERAPRVPVDREIESF